MDKRRIIMAGVLVGLLMAGCQREVLLPNGSEDSDKIIRVGGVHTGQLTAHASQVTTRAEIDEETVQRTDAENIPWLKGVLMNGLDITYGKASDRSGTSRVAVLQLQTDGSGNIKYTYNTDELKLAEYTFLYKDGTHEPAIWYDNGAHFFEGLHVPGRIIQGASNFPADFTSDQHDDTTGDSEAVLGNYTLLSHYLAMPANFTLNATIARIKLPFHHRLARVLAYILIDPSLGDVKIKGYNYVDEDHPDDPVSSLIRFCNVKVLDKVKDNGGSGSQHYSPQWTEVRKAVPHFVGERGSYDDASNKSFDPDHFIAFYDTHKKEYIYPTTDTTQWKALRLLPYDGDGLSTSDGGRYQRTVYGTVPVYDLIVRPTYTDVNNVMYDEEGLTTHSEKQALVDGKNKIEFEITLENGLNYYKEFEFQLDANYETVVYLHINRAGVDYSSSGSVLWEETTGYDDYYGVNNQNGNTLSIAGSGWQRAYTNSDTNYWVTDGHYYLHDTEDEYAQYVTDARWIEMFREARAGGRHHGDYFILARDISIPAAALPEGFAFTGHLDGMDHTITLTGDGYTEVTARAYDEYVAYTNGSGTEPKYIRLEDGSYQRVPDNAVYYILDGETYVAIADIVAYTGDSAYAKEEGEDEYDPVSFFKKVHHNETTVPVAGKSPSSLFARLDGTYTTAQESDMSAPWEANVHYERRDGKNYWVPLSGWRAEIINTNVDGATVFPSGIVYGTEVTGYVHNCWEGSDWNGSKWIGGNPVTDYTPPLPEY